MIYQILNLPELVWERKASLASSLWPALQAAEKRAEATSEVLDNLSLPRQVATPGRLVEPLRCFSAACLEEVAEDDKNQETVCDDGRDQHRRPDNTQADGRDSARELHAVRDDLTTHHGFIGSCRGAGGCLQLSCYEQEKRSLIIYFVLASPVCCRAVGGMCRPCFIFRNKKRSLGIGIVGVAAHDLSNLRNSLVPTV